MFCKSLYFEKTKCVEAVAGQGLLAAQEANLMGSSLLPTKNKISLCPGQ
jgi:hypothetical protein